MVVGFRSLIYIYIIKMARRRNKQAIFKNLYFRDLKYIFYKTMVLKELITVVNSPKPTSWFGWNII